MNELQDLKSTRKADQVANPESQALLGEATKSVFDTFRERPLETAGGALVAATLGIAAVRLKSPALEKLAATEAPSVTRSGLHFDKLQTKTRDCCVIPSFRAEGGPQREQMRIVPWKNIVSIGSTDASVYFRSRFSIFPIYQRNRRSGATAFMADESGLIATANHVVSDTRQSYFVRLKGERVPARLMAIDKESDLAILKVDTNVKSIRPLELSLNHNDIRQGREAFLIGFPDGAQVRVMTSGPLHNLNYVGKLGGDADFVNGVKKEYFRSGWVQHLVPSFGGNSGGPLLLENGKVVGVHSKGKYTSDFASASSVLHLPPMLDELRLRPMANGFSEIPTKLARTFIAKPKSVIKPSEPISPALPPKSTDLIA
jgi:S1-C subfamily serine protease